MRFQVVLIRAVLFLGLFARVYDATVNSINENKRRTSAYLRHNDFQNNLKSFSIPANLCICCRSIHRAILLGISTILSARRLIIRRQSNRELVKHIVTTISQKDFTKLFIVETVRFKFEFSTCISVSAFRQIGYVT
jgi:hypothetical protein